MTRFMCPFCYAEFTGAPQLCSGPFRDRDHPSGVRPIMVEFENDGHLRAGEKDRLAEARDTYRR